MATVLCYGDSLTWGAAPQGGRFNRNQRWPELLAKQLGEQHEVINFGLPGRTTIWNDPFREGRNGSLAIQSALEIFGPVDILIIMLGTNDLKHYFNIGAYEASKGIEQIIHKVHAPSPHKFAAPKIVIVAPPNILSPKGDLTDMYRGAVEKSQELHQHYQRVATINNCVFLNSSSILQPSELDGVHFDLAANKQLSQSLTPLIKELINC
ncbi:SGNH/GDSL hydrolase family protein [Marinomonas sp. 15G1-11]|uniref:SGNH/GDSL hydrolase family protein n=1 Tax=Marinomonas phaeophyticola TaxID=3004091 RepID=A0ABT4JU21_9GAMM|nr:SGNH/GDSL hydrolase family protein [Marinomonas sp. 15G1-11]MCZ2721884.1 SGNH/GDSL hydrolase family protein [Marinomonas sp. 15G1-11]